MWRGETGLGKVRQDWSEVLASEENIISYSAETPKPEATRGRHSKRRNPYLSCTMAWPLESCFSLPWALIYQDRQSAQPHGLTCSLQGRVVQSSLCPWTPGAESDTKI